MAVLSLKINFRKFLLTLVNYKFIFVKCKSVSVMTVPLSFPLQPKRFLIVVLSSNYWLYDFNATRFQKY